MKAFKLYKVRSREEALPVLMSVAAAELHHPKRKSLLAAFRAVLPTEEHGKFDVLVHTARSQPGGLNIIRPPGQQMRPLPLPPPSVSTLQKGIATSGAANVRIDAKAALPQGLTTAGNGRYVVSAGGYGGLSALQGGSSKALASGKVSTISKPTAGSHVRDSRRSGAGSKVPAPPCGICKKRPCESPHASQCCPSLIACFHCWLTAVALHSCPGCKQELKRGMLSKKYFV